MFHQIKVLFENWFDHKNLELTVNSSIRSRTSMKNETCDTALTREPPITSQTTLQYLKRIYLIRLDLVDLSLMQCNLCILQPGGAILLVTLKIKISLKPLTFE